MIDNELKHLGQLALANAFYKDFSALVNAYIIAGTDLSATWTVEEALGEVTSVYGRDEGAGTDGAYINLYGNLQGSSFSTCGYESIVEAFEDDRATEIVLQGKKIFRRDEAGEWFYCGDEE